MSRRNQVLQPPIPVPVLVLVSLFVCVACLVVSAGARAAVVYDPAADCIRSDPPGLSPAPGSTHTSVGDVQVLSLPTDSLVADGLQSDVGSLAPALESVFTPAGDAPPLLPVGPAGGPYQVFVAPESDFRPGDDGVTARYCGHSQTAVAISGSSHSPASTLAHELCHALIVSLVHGRSGGSTRDSWFQESLCELDALALRGSSDEIAQEDERFFGDLQIPLDVFRSTDGLEDSHEYAAWRFQQWLQARLGSDYAGFTRAVLLSTHTGDDSAAVSAIVDRELHAVGRSLHGELENFWGQHLLPESEQQPISTGPQIDRGSGELDANVTVSDSISLRRLSAKEGGIRVSSNVEKIVIEPRDVGREAKVWAWWPGHSLVDLSDRGAPLEFCTSGASGSQLSWPGEVRLMTVNGSSRDVDLIPANVVTSSKRCKRQKHPPPPPRPPQNSCSASPHDGEYSTGTSALPVAYLTLQCINGRKYVYVFGGSSTCNGNPDGDPVSFGIAGGGHVVEYAPGGQGDLHGDGFDFTYTYSGTTITVVGSFGGGVATGTVHFSRPGSTCTQAQSFTAPLQ